MLSTTVVTVPNVWTDLTALMIAARIAANQEPLSQFAAQTIDYTAPTGNVGDIGFSADHRIAGMGETVAKGTTKTDEGFPGAEVSTRMYFVKSTNGTDLLNINMMD
jgi:hypothetical protein